MDRGVHGGAASRGDMAWVSPALPVPTCWCLAYILEETSLCGAGFLAAEREGLVEEAQPSDQQGGGRNHGAGPSDCREGRSRGWWPGSGRSSVLRFQVLGRVLQDSLTRSGGWVRDSGLRECGCSSRRRGCFLAEMGAQLWRGGGGKCGH